jgi:hypothetical protein
MAFAQLTCRESLRDIESCLRAVPAKLYHLGIRGTVSRTTLAYANEQRDWRVFANFAQVLIADAREMYAKDTAVADLTQTIYALDSTTIDLCLELFPWAKFRRTKAAVKLHTLIDLRGSIPTFIHITDGKVHDVNALDMLTPEPGAYYIMDRGYQDLERFHRLHLAGSFFVTRPKTTLLLRRIQSQPIDKTTGVRSDWIVAANGVKTATAYPERLRRIRFRDVETKKTLIFITNDFVLPAHVIAALYRARCRAAQTDRHPATVNGRRPSSATSLIVLAPVGPLVGTRILASGHAASGRGSFDLRQRGGTDLIRRP